MGSSTVVLGIFTDGITYVGLLGGVILGAIILLAAGFFGFRLGWRYFKKMVK